MVIEDSKESCPRASQDTRHQDRDGILSLPSLGGGFQGLH